LSIKKNTLTLQANCSLVLTHLWLNCKKVKIRGALYIVNSLEQLQPLVSEYHVFPHEYSIDFDSKTLLLVRGCATNGIVELQKKLTRIVGKTVSYNLQIVAVLNDATVMEPWTVALLADKFDATYVLLKNFIPQSPEAIEAVAEKEALVYPSPTGGLLHIGIAGEYRIVGIDGRTFLSGHAVQGQPVDVSVLKPGIYLLRTTTGKSARFVKK
jgi:hypothetical protein